MAHTSRSLRHAAALAGAAAALGLLTACGGGSGADGSAQASSGSTAVTGGTAGGSGGGSAASSGGSAASAASARSTRCHTSELRASVGSEGPGAGQENFALVLTNASGHTCTVTGYPGAAFTDASGRQLGSDP
ncbi:DUF4232 domain-containing protein [Streptomyces sp. OE57]|uniref:DUF4232 domain-containing protein n=1 Tax=Streptomyces lacaronensis TaxID=3379885 RepID=UPI0039B7413F